MYYILSFLIFIAGIFTGYLLFKDSKPRSLLTINKCINPLNRSELLGLIGSVVVQKIPGVIPDVIEETDKTRVVKHPRPTHKIHYMFVPKKDIKNIGELYDEDKESIMDIMSTIVDVINREKISNYQLLTNGHGRQDVAYLHFHLMTDLYNT